MWRKKMGSLEGKPWEDGRNWVGAQWEKQISFWQSLF